MRYFHHAATLLSLLTVFGCGNFDRIDNGGFTRVSFQNAKRGKLQAFSTLPYGVVIYGYSDTYVTNIKLTDALAAGSMSLPNGVYRFYGYGYNYNPDSGGTDIRCAVTPSFALTGQDQTVDLTFTQAACADGAFAESSAFLEANSVSNTLPNSGPIFAPVDPVHCSTAADTALSSITASYMDCSTAPSTGISAPWSAVAAVQIVTPLFVSNGTQVTKTGEAWRSSCSAMFASSNGGAAMSSQYRVPIGASTAPGLFPMEIDTFSDASCTSVPIATHKFQKGLVFGPTGGGAGKVLAVSSSMGYNRARIYLRQP